jgi:hypothetical protein
VCVVLGIEQDLVHARHALYHWAIPVWDMHWKILNVLERDTACFVHASLAQVLKADWLWTWLESVFIFSPQWTYWTELGHVVCQRRLPGETLWHWATADNKCPGQHQVGWLVPSGRNWGGPVSLGLVFQTSIHDCSSWLDGSCSASEMTKAKLKVTGMWFQLEKELPLWGKSPMQGGSMEEPNVNVRLSPWFVDVLCCVT